MIEGTIHDFHFFHIPRTGGNSLKRWLNKSVDFDRKNQINHNYRDIKARLKHLDDSLKTFTILRNPFERILSSYFWLKVGPREEDIPESKKFVKSYNSFDEFVLDGLEDAKKRQLHFFPQTFWVCDSEKKFIPDLVLRTKSLNNSCSILSDLFKNIENKKVPNSYESNRLSFYESYTKDSILKVSLLYHDDIKLFDELFGDFGSKNKVKFSEKHNCYIV